MDAAFSEALIAVLPNLRRFAISLTRKADQAEDLVQITAERAILNAGSFDRSQQLAPWVFRIMRNAFIDQTRRQKIAGRQVDIHDMPEAIPVDPAPELEARLMLQSVEAALTHLSVDQREVLHLVCVEELSYADTAAILGIPTGTVMSRLSRARLALSQKLGIK